MRAYEAIRYNDGKGTVESITHRMYGSNGALLKAMDYAYTYGDPAKGEIPDSLYKYEIGSDIDLTFTYDKLARLTHRNLITDSINKTESYTYKASDRGGTYTTTLVESMTDLAGVTHTYEYDANGNILSDTYGGYTVSYEYDSLNRMTHYNDPVYGWTYVYVYDNRGNITEMHEHHYTAGDLGEPLNVYEYEYGDSIWADLLTSYWGEEIEYDEIGNPLNWIWGESLTWQNGRQLASYDESVNYTYNADGLRTGKSGDKNTEYYIVNGTYIGETTTINGTPYTLSYFYDENGAPAGLWLGNAVYYFSKNLQGDITAILDYAGNVLAKYRYDAYGAIISVTDANGNNISSATHIANLNPFRYRGYMYDEESGFYYVSSRYYDPYVGRWLNADIPETLTVDFENFAQYNLFAYCFNNPVNMSDETGAFPKWAKKVVAAAAIVAVVAVVAVVTVYTAGAGTAAAVIAVGAAKGAALGMASGAVIGAASGAVNHRVSTGSWKGADQAALEGVGDGALSGAVTGAITGAAGSALKVGQAAKAWDSGTFKSGYQSMKYHYKEHVVKEGLTKGNNVIKYTQDAMSFANRNSSALKYTYNYNYGNASWNLRYVAGQGGMFTSTGKIFTFWYR